VLKTKLTLVPLGTGSSDDLKFIMKGSRPFIPIRRKKGGRKTTSNGAFTKESKAGVVDLRFLFFELCRRVKNTRNDGLNHAIESR